MFSREDYSTEPDVQKFGEYINNPLWSIFVNYMKEKYNVNPVFEFSKCSWEYGWNAKFKKSGKTLCTVYPKENYFTIMIVIGKNEKENFEKIFSSLTKQIQNIYVNTEEGNGQRWLMIDVEDDDNRFEDVKQIIEIRTK